MMKGQSSQINDNNHMRVARSQNALREQCHSASPYRGAFVLQALIPQEQGAPEDAADKGEQTPQSIKNNFSEKQIFPPNQ